MYRSARIVPESNKSIKLSFTDIYEKRSNIKKYLYIKVSLLGISIAVISLIIYGVCFGLIKMYSILFDSLIIITTCTRVIGICIVSIVPTDEVDIIKICSENEIMRKVCYFIGMVVWFLYGLYFILFHPNKSNPIGAAMPPFLMSIWCLYFLIKNESGYAEILLLLQSCLLELILHNILNIFTPVNYNTTILSMFMGIIFILFFIWKTYDSINIYRSYKINNYQDSPKKYNISVLYHFVYQICFVFSINAIINAIHWYLNNNNDHHIRNALVWLLLAVFDILPMIIVIIYGKKYCFSLLARIYEFSLDRQQEDGSIMAALISKFQVQPTEDNEIDNKPHKILWIYRNQDIDKEYYCKTLSKQHERDKLNDGYIDRMCWIKAIILQTTENKSHYVRVDFDEDNNLQTMYRYENTSLKLHMKLENYFDNGSIGTIIEEKLYNFNHWLNYFKEYNPEIDLETKSITFWYPKENFISNNNNSNNNCNNKTEKIEETAEKLLKWDRENLRQINSKSFFAVVNSNNNNKSFKYDLFTTSPRDLSNWKDEDENELLKHMNIMHSKDIIEFLRIDQGHISDEYLKQSKIEWKKKILHELSVPIKSSSHKKIDYFISHSWEDNGMNKCHALETFINDSKHELSFWFDKVCIDQKDTSKGIEALPINIGACKKILILMGKTYMTRLWCIWELFMLFTFCNKELSLERIEIICIDDDIDVKNQIENFDIDKAHAFDPNEEYRLRCIMLDVVGKDKVKEIFKHMVNLIKLGKVSRINREYKLKKVINTNYNN